MIQLQQAWNFSFSSTHSIFSHINDLVAMAEDILDCEFSDLCAVLQKFNEVNHRLRQEACFLSVWTFGGFLFVYLVERLVLMLKICNDFH